MRPEARKAIVTKKLAIELTNVAVWLENGCDPQMAAKELRLMAAAQGESEPEGDPMPDMAHLDAIQLRRIIARHVRFREEAVRLLQQVNTGYEGEWPEIRQFLERVNARPVLAENRKSEP